jgi:hypothetical protein
MTFAARVTAPSVRPVYAGWLDFATDPIFGWTGPGVFAPAGTGDPILDGNVFTSVDAAIDISSISDGFGAGSAATVSYSMHDQSSSLFNQLVSDRASWQLRRAKIWLFFLQDDQATVWPEYRQLFSGVMSNASITRREGEPSVVNIKIDRDARKAGTAPSRLVDHVRFNPADTWSSFIIPLVNGQISSAEKTPSGGSIPISAGGGFGRSGGSGVERSSLINLR